MKKLMKVETNASTMFVTYDDNEKIVRVLDNEYTNDVTSDIKSVEDDSSWEMYENVEDIEKWLGIDSYIVEEIEVDF